jgi:PhzF family phenazine biosynthesis protein
MAESVDECSGQVFTAQDFGPALQREIGGDHEPMRLMSLSHHLEEQLGDEADDSGETIRRHATRLRERFTMGLSIFVVDAFTDRRFGGNPAAVCILPEPRDAGWMQSVGSEMNLPETAFLLQRGEGFELRWFTPAVEVDLCGHATLASAHILWETGLLGRGEPAVFHTRSGRLSASYREGEVELDFPATPDQPVSAPKVLLEALGAIPSYVGRSGFDFMVELASEKVIRGLAPDLEMLKTLDVRGVIVTARSDSSEFDFVSRFFAPAAGIDEDSVTGSAHCCLGPYWSRKLGKKEFTAYQASARGGIVRLRICDDRVLLAGKAVTVLRGELLVD